MHKSKCCKKKNRRAARAGPSQGTYQLVKLASHGPKHHHGVTMGLTQWWILTALHSGVTSDMCSLDPPHGDCDSMWCTGTLALQARSDICTGVEV
jgi:hypothetical protein